MHRRGRCQPGPILQSEIVKNQLHSDLGLEPFAGGRPACHSLPVSSVGRNRKTHGNALSLACFRRCFALAFGLRPSCLPSGCGGCPVPDAGFDPIHVDVSIWRGIPFGGHVVDGCRRDMVLHGHFGLGLSCGCLSVSMAQWKMEIEGPHQRARINIV